MNIIFTCTANRVIEAERQKYTFKINNSRSALVLIPSERHGKRHVKTYMLDVADRIICAKPIHSDWIVKNIDKKYLPKIEILHLGDTDNGD
jgi:hypothetical protein